MTTKLHNHVKKYHKHYLGWLGIIWLILISFSLISSITQTFADVTGPNDPSIVNDNTTVGTIGWTTLNKVKASDDVYATTILDDNEISYYIKATDFNFSIPTGAIIDGITVKIEKSATTAKRIKDYSVRIVKGGNIKSEEKADASRRGISDSYTTYGSDSDLWGEKWTTDAINRTGFGVAISAFKDTTTWGSITGLIDHIKIKITYTPADIIKPVITLLGDSEVTITVGDTYTDAGATALDDVDGDITSGIVTVNLVDTNVVSGYTITYNVSDAAGNSATQVTRTVNVVNTAPTHHYHNNSSYYYPTTETTTEEHGVAWTGEEAGTGGITTTGTQGSVSWSTYSDDVNNAYLYAYDIGLITEPTIQDVNMGGTFTRANMAKIISDYAMNVLNKVANTGAICNFTDIADQSAEVQANIKLACQLGLMGINMTTIFHPNRTVDQAQFGTILSRTIWGDTYNGWTPYYLNHLNALKTNGIITAITPDVLETMQDVMQMIYNASNL